MSNEQILTLPLSSVTLYLGDASSNTGLGGLDGGGTATPSNLRDAIASQEPATLNQLTVGLNDKVISSSNFTADDRLVATVNGTREIIESSYSISDIPLEYIAAFDGMSALTTQDPPGLSTGGTDNPIIVGLGAEQSNAYVSLTKDDVGDPEGNIITFNTAGIYVLTYMFQFGRNNGIGEVRLHLQPYLNDVPTLNPIISELDTSTFADTKISALVYNFSQNDVLKFELRRLALNAGTNDGGLYQFDPDVTGLPVAPSARVVLVKLQ